ncbi:MAG: glycosyltransferase family 2 protein [Turicibacter sp.]|nr:glycosyltransferase family 2 protein [Turicibacter sp.]
MKPKILYLVLPCYNESEVLGETAWRLKEKLHTLIREEKVADTSKIVFVNDGSTDQTWRIIEALHQSDSVFSGLQLTRNRGHQNALLAGLMTVKDLCDFTISMDADLQDDMDAIDEMVAKYASGYDVVYGVRDNRDADTWFKRTSASLYYRLLQKMSGSQIIAHHADYRLMSQQALTGLAEFKEVNLFLRGMVPLVGFDHDIVYYKRGERFAGRSKYPLKKMIQFAAEGITSFSVTPLRFIFFLGLASFVVSFIFGVYFVVSHFVGQTVSGWSSLIVSIWAIGGLQLLSIGVIGEYIAKTYLESKGRPKYLVQHFLNEK